MTVEKPPEMFVRVTPEQFERLRQCAVAFEMGARGPDGWRETDVREQLGMWAMARGGYYDRARHEVGEPVRIEVVWP